MIAPRPENEAQRVEELLAYNVLDTPPEAAFDRVTRMAARIFDAPIVLISLVDEGRQWFKSCYGLDTRETSRDLAFCAHALLADGPLMVPDAALDPRFYDNPLVTGSPHIRFYAGAPLISPRGLKLGTLCVIDMRPRTLDASALTTLVDLAAIVVDELELRLSAQQKNAEIEERKRVEDALSAREEHFRNLIENAHDIISVLSPEGAILYQSPALQTVLGYSQEEVVGRSAFEFIHPDDVGLVSERLGQVATTDAPVAPVEFRFLHQDGSWRWLEAIGSPQWEYSQPQEYSRLEADAPAHEKTLVGIIINSRDVTSRKDVEDELLDEQERFFKAFDLSPIGIALVAPHGRWLRVNRALSKIIGYDRNELLATDFQNITHPDDLAAELELMQQLLDGKRSSFQLEKRYLDKNASGVWVLLDASLVRDGDGAPQYFISQVQDITARKAGEMELQDSQARLSGIIETALDAIIIMDSAGRVMEWNPSAQRIFGFTREQVLERELATLILPPELRQAHYDGIAKYLTSGQGAIMGRRVELPALRADGEEITIELMAERLPLGGEPVFAGFVRDITQSKRAEERLRLLESVAVNANDAILITEAEPIRGIGPRILYANEAFLRETGYSLDEIIGQTPRILQGPNTPREPLDKIRAALENWEPVVAEVYNYRKDGTPFWSELSIVPVADEKGWYTHWVSIQRDVTEQKQHALILNAAKEEAETANRAKSEFLSRMSHELRTPLNAILGFGQLLEMAELPQEDLESAEQITHAGRHLLALINEVLDISRIETGQLAVSLEPVVLSEVLAEALGLVRALAAETGVLLPSANALDNALKTGPNGAEICVRADRQRLRQVLINLLSNAIKYNRNGGSVTILAEEIAGDKIRIGIRDTGAGIAAENLNRVFTPFDRLGAENGEVEGTGIGLALSQRLTQLMQGVLSVESIVGNGSTFWVELPSALDPASLPQTKKSLVRAAPLQTMETRWLVLYIEDNLSNLQLLQRVLAHRPEIKLISARDGVQGLELARGHRPNLILLDLHLPIMQGEEVLRRLRAEEETRDLPVIILSADATPGQIERLQQNGAQAYVTKPFNVRELLDAIGEHMRDHTPVFPKE